MARKKSRSPNKPEPLALPSVGSFLDAPPVETSHERGMGNNDEEQESENNSLAVNLYDSTALQLQSAPVRAESPAADSADEQPTHEHPKRRDNNFLDKMWQFLDSDNATGIMQFSVNGRYLLILDPEAVPAALDHAGICKHKNYGSFQRQCCIYGWRRIPQNEVPRLVLDDNEDPGATISTLGDHIKVMQHETLVRDSARDEVRSVTRKAKPKPSRAKDAETRLVANIRLRAEEAEREARQKEQEKLVNLHRIEEKRRQEEQRRREQMKREHSQHDTSTSGLTSIQNGTPVSQLQAAQANGVEQDLTYDPALSRPPGLPVDFALDPDLRGPSPAGNNALVVAASIPKQANSNAATGRAKTPQAATKKRKASLTNGGSKENTGGAEQPTPKPKASKKAKKQANTNFADGASFDAVAGTTPTDASASLYPNTQSAQPAGAAVPVNNYGAYSNAFAAPAAQSASVSLAGLPSSGSGVLAPGSVSYEPLPKSLQEAFLILEEPKSSSDSLQSNSGGATNNVAPVPSSNFAMDTSLESLTSMIDPALTGLIPQGSAMQGSSGNPSIMASSNGTGGSAAYSSGPGSSATPLVNPASTVSYPYPGSDPYSGTYDPQAASSGNIASGSTSMSNPYYYQSPANNTYTDGVAAGGPQISPPPPYFSSAFTGLADLQATNW